MTLPQVIKTKADWIETAQYVIPLLPEYMAGQRNNVLEDKIATELISLLKAEDWKGLHGYFQSVWNWLPDRPEIHRHPFGLLCSLCSEEWAIHEGEEQ